MDPDGNRLINSCSPRHWGHSMHGLQLLFVEVFELQSAHHMHFGAYGT